MARADAVATLLGLVAIVMLGCCVANNPVLGATIDGDKRQQGQNVATVDDAPVDKEAIAVIDIGRSDEESEEDDVVSLNSDETDDYGSVEQQEVEGVSDEATGAVLNDSGANEGKRGVLISNSMPAEKGVSRSLRKSHRLSFYVFG